MAISIIQQPSGSSNATFTQLPYVVSGSTNTSQQQFEYVMDIYPSGSSTLLSRVTQPVNPAGVAVFNPSRIFQGDAEYSQEWKDMFNSGSLISDKQYEVKFGEKYGTSISSSVTIYPNQVSSSIALVPASIDPNQGSYDLYSVYPYLEIKVGGADPGPLPGNDDTQLSDNPYLFYLKDDPRNPYTYDNGLSGQFLISYLPLATQDYNTTTHLVKGLQPGRLSVDVRDINNNFIFVGYQFIDESIVQPQFLGKRSYYSGSIDSNVNLWTIGSGPANLRQTPMENEYTASLGNQTFGDVIDSGSWASYRVFGEIFETGGGNADIDFIYVYNEELLKNNDIRNIVTGVLGNDNIPFYVSCNQKVRFAFINRYGVWDYWSNFNPVRRNTDVQRDTVNLPKLDYSGITSPYSYISRGEETYFTDWTDTYTVDTPYLDEPFANWLEQLIESPSVFIQDGDDFIPIVITNSSYTSNTNENRQKLFQYTITFRPAKGRQLFF